MTSAQTTILSEMINSGTYAAGYAKYLLIKFDGMEWEPQVCFPSEPAERRSHSTLQEYNNNVLIYPNPTNDFIQIEIVDCDNCRGSIEIFDISGRKVLSTCISKPMTIVSIDELTFGQYIVKLVVDNITHIEKIVKTD